MAKQFKPVIKKKLILPLLKFSENETIYVKVISPIVQGKNIQSSKKVEIEKPADLCNVINMMTGDEMQIIVPAVVKSVLEQEYPDQSYVDLGFAITRGEKQPGKRYINYRVDEIEV